MSRFNTNMAISDKKSGVESNPYPVKEGQRHINLNPGHLFVQQPPKKERDRQAHLYYYTIAPTTGKDSYRTARLN